MEANDLYTIKSLKFIHFDKRKGLVYPCFKIACAHPDLLDGLNKISKSENINLQITKEKKNWSGLNGLSSNSINSILNFLKIGGFVRGVKIAKSSKYFSGFDKQDVLLGILEFMVRQRKNKKFRIVDKVECYKYVRRIIKAGEFGNDMYYIKSFSDFKGDMLKC